MRIYISGKISGCPIEEAREKFAAAACCLAGLGHTPVNPFDNGVEPTADWSAQMVRDIELLFGCEAIYLLNDWADSRGARIEQNIARECGMKIIPQTDMFMLPSGNYVVYEK